MKKLILICASALLLTACSEKNQYEEAVLAQMEKEQDIKDYNIDPQEMTDCVVESTSKNMPGFFPFDVEKLTAYQNYTKMLSMNNSKDKKKSFEELRSVFGSPKELGDAHSNYTESQMTCINIFIQRSEDQEKADPE